MSRVPTYLNSGPMMNDPESVINSYYIPQGVAADLVATMDNIRRSELDAFALRSHQRAIAARNSDTLKASMEPIHDQNGLVILNKDVLPSSELDITTLASLPARYADMGIAGFDAMALHRFPLVSKVDHLHSHGNTSPAADGAAVCLLGTKERGAELGLTPKAIIRSVAMATTDATLLTGGVAAAKLALKKAKLEVKDVDLWEFNESFAAPSIRFQRELNIQDDHFNVYGGAIALGEPLGAIGGMMLCHLLGALTENNASIGCLTIDAGSGLALSTVIESVSS